MSKLNLNNFRGPFVVETLKTELTHCIRDAQGEQIASLHAPDDNSHGIKFGKDHAELLGKSFELLDNTIEVNEIANRADISAEERLEAIRKLCARFI